MRARSLITTIAFAAIAGLAVTVAFAPAPVDAVPAALPDAHAVGRARIDLIGRKVNIEKKDFERLNDLEVRLDLAHEGKELETPREVHNLGHHQLPDLQLLQRQNFCEECDCHQDPACSACLRCHGSAIGLDAAQARQTLDRRVAEQQLPSARPPLGRSSGSNIGILLQRTDCSVCLCEESGCQDGCSKCDPCSSTRAGGVDVAACVASRYPPLHPELPSGGFGGGAGGHGRDVEEPQGKRESAVHPRKPATTLAITPEVAARNVKRAHKILAAKRSVHGMNEIQLAAFKRNIGCCEKCGSCQGQCNECFCC